MFSSCILPPRGSNCKCVRLRHGEMTRAITVCRKTTAWMRSAKSWRCGGDRLFRDPQCVCVHACVCGCACDTLSRCCHPSASHVTGSLLAARHTLDLNATLGKCFAAKRRSRLWWRVVEGWGGGGVGRVEEGVSSDEVMTRQRGS